MPNTQWGAPGAPPRAATRTHTVVWIWGRSPNCGPSARGTVPRARGDERARRPTPPQVTRAALAISKPPEGTSLPCIHLRGGSFVASLNLTTRWLNNESWRSEFERQLFSISPRQSPGWMDAGSKMPEATIFGIQKGQTRETKSIFRDVKNS